MILLPTLLSGLLILIRTDYPSIHRQLPTLNAASDGNNNNLGGDVFVPTAATTPASTTDSSQSQSKTDIVLNLVSTWQHLQQENKKNIYNVIDNKKITMEPLQEKGFCNALYQVSNIGIAKLFSPLAQARMKQSGFLPGEIDTILADQKLGPKILATSSKGILMEYLPYKALTEDLVQGQDSESQSRIQSVAQALAQMHTAISFVSSSASPRPEGDNEKERGGFYPNMLWHTIEVMLSIIPHEDEARKYLKEQVELHQKTMHDLNLPTVLGHGDFKPSNVMVVGDGSARFLDLECAGKHYRAYDLAKFFRIPLDKQTPITDANQQLFLTIYLQSATENRLLDPQQLRSLVQILLLECKLFLPMTWLEAIVFFECSSHIDSDNRDQWKSLAKQRMEEYNQSMKIHLPNVRAFSATTTDAKSTERER